MIPLRIPEDNRETMMCKMFASILKGVALMWYYGIKSRSIDSFEDLSKSSNGLL